MLNPNFSPCPDLGPTPATHAHPSLPQPSRHKLAVSCSSARPRPWASLLTCWGSHLVSPTPARSLTSDRLLDGEGAVSGTVATPILKRLGEVHLPSAGSYSSLVVTFRRSMISHLLARCIIACGFAPSDSGYRTRRLAAVRGRRELGVQLPLSLDEEGLLVGLLPARCATRHRRSRTDRPTGIHSLPLTDDSADERCHQRKDDAPPPLPFPPPTYLAREHSK